MIAGRLWPQIGGEPKLLDIVGVNYYHDNQWIHGGPPIDDRPRFHRPFRNFLTETYARYGRPFSSPRPAPRATPGPPGSP